VIHAVSVLVEPLPLLAPQPDAFFVNAEALAAIRTQEQEAVERALQEAAQWLGREGVEVKTSIRQGDPAHALLAAAAEENADLLVLGSKGLTGLQGFLMGSVARNVAKHSRRPVLVARAPRNSIRQVVVATDGSEHAKHAASFAARLPLPEEAEITVASVTRAYDPFLGVIPREEEEFDVDAAVREVNERRAEGAGGAVEDARERLAPTRRPIHTELRTGDPATQILSLAEEKEADLIVAGARGGSLIEHLLVGSVADRLLKEARCSLLIVH
jgi:nucleotide-binding universal stress UspA family protein